MGNSEWIYGRNPVLEVLRSKKREVQEIRVASGAELSGVLAEVFTHAQTIDVPIKRVPKADLERINDNHQGVVARVSAYTYVELEAILDHAVAEGEDAFILMLDVIQDPQNLGTLLRTAEAVGVHGVILPSKRSATVTPAVVSASSGASEHLRIAQHNLAQAIRLLKDGNVWVAGLDVSRQSKALDQVDLSGPIAIVVGNEGHGMRRLVQDSCDHLVHIPMRGKIASLNAAVAGSLVLFHVWSRRDFEGFAR